MTTVEFNKFMGQKLDKMPERERKALNEALADFDCAGVGCIHCPFNYAEFVDALNTGCMITDIYEVVKTRGV